MSIKDNLKARRLYLNMTLEEVAKQVNVTRATIQKYENGIISNIPSDKIELLAKALKTSPVTLMGWEEPPDIDSCDYSRRFSDNLQRIIENSDESDLEQAGIDLHEANLIIDGSISLTFDRACEIADQLGETIDSMLGIEKPAISSDDGSAEILKVFTSLSTENRSKLLELSRLYLNDQRKTRESR